MAYAPDSPFPKDKGDAIRSQDWNELVEEVRRLDSEKVDDDGGHVEGELTVEGNLGVGTENPQDAIDVHGAVCFNSDTNQRVYGATRKGRDTVVLDAHWDELEVKGRVIDWSGTNLHIGYENPHPAHRVYLGRKTQGVTLHSGGDAHATLTTRNERVGIGTSNPSQDLHVVGQAVRLQKPGTSQHLNLSAHGSGLDIFTNGAHLYLNNNDKEVRVRNFRNISSREYKDDVRSLSSTAAKAVLDELAPVTYRFKGQKTNTKNYGFISEDSPSVATEDSKAIDTLSITAVLTQVVKQQQEMIATLREEVEGLKAKLA